jgi:THO complex subunit 4
MMPVVRRISVQPRSCQELFKKTVGPLKESFLIYNSQGKSKGMAIVSFQRPGDAVVARTKYDGKIVDGSACSLLPCFSALLNIVPLPSLLCSRATLED